MSEFEDPYRCRSTEYWGARGMFRRAAAMGTTIGATVISAPRYVPESRPYVYRGTGRDELTAFLDAEPHKAEPLTRRQERMQMLASLPPVHSGSEPVPPPGYITVAQAAEQLGVSVRTIERYKRELAGSTR